MVNCIDLNYIWLVTMADIHLYTSTDYDYLGKEKYFTTAIVI